MFGHVGINLTLRNFIATSTPRVTGNKTISWKLPLPIVVGLKCPLIPCRSSVNEGSET